MSSWANTYVDEKVNGCHWSSVNINAHGFFYAVCQAIFYVFAFRNKELIGSRKCKSSQDHSRPVLFEFEF